AVIFSPEFTPFKGLDIKPIYSYFYAQGTTSTSSRRNATNITTPAAFSNAAFGSAANAAAGSVAGAAAYQSEANGAVARYANGDSSNHESRHPIGRDARWRSGPFSLAPTFLFQWGKRSMVDYAGPAGAAYTRHKEESDTAAVLFDVQGGYQLGPLL